ncbi:MAG: hypothetical protein ACK5TK_10550 [Betaproteobacteria bacterium]
MSNRCKHLGALWRGLWAAALLAAAPSWAGPGDSWNIDPNVITLDPGNRFVGNIVAINRGASPVFVRATITRVELDANGARQRAPAEQGPLRVYPSEFALRPNEAFTVRVIANPGVMTHKAESFYVKMVDVGEVGFSGAQPNAGAMAVLLGFEALVAVNRERSPRELPATSLAVSRAEGVLRITNRSQRHVYLLEGFGCPNARTFTTECEKIADFPRQSMLPDESVTIKAAVGSPFIALAFQPDLNATSQRQLVYLDNPTSTAAR